MNIVYLRNKKVSPQDKISLFNPTFLYGINVFEGIRGYWSEIQKKLKIFDIDEHLDRLYNSADIIGFNVPVKKNVLKSELLSIIEEENIRENIYIRITFFIDGDNNWAEQNSIERLISIRSMESSLGLAKPQSLIISSYRRISSNSVPPFVKAGANYLNSRYALIEAQSRGFEGALFLSQNDCISESTGSCIFFVKDGVLFTPSVESDILVGVTRNRIIKLALSLNIPVREMLIHQSEISTFEASFLVGTMIELKPICTIEDKHFDTSHAMTNQLIKALKNYVYGVGI
jgi:branched-chain amino acid aminotransferase